MKLPLAEFELLFESPRAGGHALLQVLAEATVENPVLQGRRVQIRVTTTEMQAPETVRPSGFVQVTIQLPRAIISLILNACNAFLTLPA